MKRTKKGVRQWCRERNIELLVEVHEDHTHVHVNIDAPRMVFRAHDLHNLGLWDGPRPVRWDAVYTELEESDYGPCEGECQYCEEQEKA